MNFAERILFGLIKKNRHLSMEFYAKITGSYINLPKTRSGVKEITSIS